MVALPLRSTFSRGITAKGDEVFIITWRDLEFFSQVHVEGGWYRTYCPIHGSDHQRSLSIKADTGFGHCFSCQTKVFVADFDPQMALRLQRRDRQKASLYVPRHSRMPTPSRVKHLSSSQDDWQAEELHLLSDLQSQGALRLDRDAAWNAQAYLEARHIPLDLAIATGVGYLEPEAGQANSLLQRWEDRLIFPLTAYDQQRTSLSGFAGRLLWHWQCCPDEMAHKCYLEQQERKRWIKTNPAGWFWEPEHLPTTDPVIIVEGPFDRLAVLATGDFRTDEVIALVGTALQPEWLSDAQKVLLALDDDQGGREASKRIEQQLRSKQVNVGACFTISNDGKDWSEVWRRQGRHGMEELYAHQALLAHDL